jgi:uncharacterized membrane protein
MEWFVFALLASIMFALCNVFDKFNLTKKIKNSFSYNIIGIAFNIFPVLLLIFYLKLNFDFSTLLATMYGLIFVFLYVVYNKAMMEEDASRVVSISKISPIFVLALSFLLLNEVLNYHKYFGIIFLVISALLVSYKKSEKRFHLSTGIILAFCFSFSIAVMGIITKYTLGYIDYWTFFLWNLIGNMIGCLFMILIPSIRRNAIRDASKIDKRTFLTVFLASMFTWLGYLFYFVATSLGNVSLVSALGSIQPLTVFIITLFLTVHRPKILKEEISKMSLTFKILAVIFIIIGSYLIVS